MSDEPQRPSTPPPLPQGESGANSGVSLADLQRLIREMYYDKDVARGIDGTFMWLMEEVGGAWLRGAIQAWLLDTTDGDPSRGRNRHAGGRERRCCRGRWHDGALSQRTRRRAGWPRCCGVAVREARPARFALGDRFRAR